MREVIAREREAILWKIRQMQEKRKKLKLILSGFDFGRREQRSFSGGEMVK